ncbi:MAG TPA: MFS transporter [Steroidobacteraceae bacterium]|nr:MFS transporter [Steroidobacteraceae bacterium]
MSFWQIWNMCFGFLGLQFGFALQNANASRIFQSLGASSEQLPLLWFAAPCSGLLVQPLVGYFSDRTWTRLGRRRPYFLVGAALAATALVLMPRAPTLWAAAALLWLLDGAFNTSMEPFRAFVGDQLGPGQRPAGYSMQSFFIGAGAVVASFLPWLLERGGVGNSTAAVHGSAIPDTVRYAFEIGAAVLVLAIGWTTLTSREYPPQELLAFDDALPAGSDRAVGPGARGGLLATVVGDLANMPLAMWRLAPVQFFSWLALFSMWIYTTPAVAQVHFGATDPHSAAYNQGANWVGVLFGAYNGFAAVAAAIIPPMVRRLGLHLTHLVNVWLGGAALLSFLVIRDPDWLVVSMIGMGFAWASVLSLPYALLSDSVPAQKMGLYMGVFNIFIVIPQMVAASVLGFLLRVLFGGAPIYALVLGGVSFIVAGLLALRVPQPES